MTPTPPPAAPPGTAPPSTALADVVLLAGATGWLSPPLRRVVPGSASGPALTVELVAERGGGGLGELFELIAGPAVAGRVLVVGGAESVTGAVWGEILTVAASGAGVRAALVAGQVRDRSTLSTLGLPVWALGDATVGPGGDVRVAAVGAPVVIGDMVVRDGDAVVVDDDGVVAVGADVAAEAIGRASAYAAAEAAVIADLDRGVPLPSAYERKKEVVDHLRARGPLRPV